MPTAFVLSGGGSLGAVQVGQLQALAAHGIRADLLVGTSAGALNAGWVAGRPADLAELERVWLGLTRQQVFPVGLQSLLGAVGLSDHLVSNRGLSRLVREHLRYARLEDASVPIHVVAADLLTGEELVLSRGDAPSALLASSAIPGVYPPVSREGRLLVDGGVVDNAAVSVALGLGADVVWVLPAGYACRLPAAPRSALGVGLHAISVLINHRLAVDVAAHEQDHEIQVLPPLCPLAVNSGDFGHAAELIGRARALAEDYLSKPPPPPGARHQVLVH